MNNRVFKAPHCVKGNTTPSVFLAGTIDNGNSEDWQEKVTSYLLENTDYHIFNPRRDNWDNSWKQSITEPKFQEQVEWELNYLDNVDVIIMHFEPKSVSPITLLELGLFATSDRLLVSCPKEFWRCGNVEVVCDYYNIPLFDNIDSLLQFLELNKELYNGTWHKMIRKPVKYQGPGE